MPELPEVETTLQAIKKFKNQNLNDVKIYNRNLRWKVNKNLEINKVKKTNNKELSDNILKLSGNIGRFNNTIYNTKSNWGHI